VVKRHLPFLIILCIISLYLLWFKLPFAGTDELMFKDPALSLIKGEGFSAPAMAGWYGHKMDIRRGASWYPPFYPFFFAAWFLIFGFSISSSLALSLLICLTAAYLLCLIWDEFDKGYRWARLYAYLLIFFCWSVLLKEISRPDPLLAIIGLYLVLLLIKKKEPWSLRYKILLILLISFALATSLGMGLLLISFLFFLFFSLNQERPRELLKFLALIIIGLTFALLVWFLCAYPNYYQMKAQINSFAEGGSLLSHPHILPYIISIPLGVSFSAFYAPLLLYLFYFLLKDIVPFGNFQKNIHLSIRLIGLVLIYSLATIKYPTKYVYLQFFYSFFIATLIFPILAKIITPKFNRIILSLCLLIAFFPVFQSRLFIPLTWSEEDTYEYNRKKILEAIPRGSKVISSPAFWYMLNDGYTYFDVNSFTPANYILFASGGSEKPDIPLRNSRFYRPSELERHFIKQLSTMSDQPNKLFGLPISRSRWSYRFELYRRIK